MVKKRKRNPKSPSKTENDGQQPETKKNKKDFHQILIDPETGVKVPLTKSGAPDMRCSIARRYMARLNSSNNSNSESVNDDNSNSSINDCSQNATFNDSSLLNSSSTLKPHALNRIISSNESENTISLNNSAITDSSPSSSIFLLSSSTIAGPSSGSISEICEALKSKQTNLPLTLSTLLEKLKLYEQQQQQQQRQDRLQETTLLTSSSTQTDPIQTSNNPYTAPLIEATTQTNDIKSKLRHVETQYHCTLSRIANSTQTPPQPSPPITESTGTQTIGRSSSESTGTQTIGMSSSESTTSSEAEEDEVDKNLDFCRVV